jgi:hypothetical protein
MDGPAIFLATQMFARCAMSPKQSHRAARSSEQADTCARATGTRRPAWDKWKARVPARSRHVPPAGMHPLLSSLTIYGRFGCKLYANKCSTQRMTYVRSRHVSTRTRQQARSIRRVYVVVPPSLQLTLPVGARTITYACKSALE